MKGNLQKSVRLWGGILILIAAGVLVHPMPGFSNTYCAGAYVTGQVGVYNWNISRSSNYILAARNPPSMTTVGMAGGGLLWSGEFLRGQFMVRQNLGFDGFMADRFAMTRFSFINTLAFVPFRTDIFFVWFGPQINLFYIWGKDATKSLFIYSDFLSTNLPVYRKRAYRILPIGTGLALGLDYEIIERLRLCIEGGFHLSTSVYGQSRDVGNVQASLTGYEGYINVSILYRFTEKARFINEED